MPSETDSTSRDFGDVVEVAQRLCGTNVMSARVCVGGANNRVYRISTAEQTYAMKSYASSEVDNRDRLAHEFDGLRFLKDNGVGNALPAALAVDRIARCALYEWIDGSAIATHGAEEITALLDMLAALHAARLAKNAAALPVATEAVFRLSDVLAQIDVRIERLNAIAATEPELAEFVNRELRPELTRRVKRLNSHQADIVLVSAQRTLSPSDVGFHNALRRRDGSLTFIDFEYFGWDDPVKLCADFLWHPGMQLSPGERRQFVDGAKHLYADDPDFVSRLHLHFPIYGMRWALIILNEFLPRVWKRRSFSGKGGDWDSAKRDQLSKARSLLTTLRMLPDGDILV